MQDFNHQQDEQPKDGQHDLSARLARQWLECLEEGVHQRVQPASGDLTPALLEQLPSLAQEFDPASGEMPADVERVAEGSGAEKDPREGDERESCQRGEWPLEAAAVYPVG